MAAKPATVSFEEAAVVPISGFAALQAVRDVGEVQAVQRVLVLGAAGAVGWYAVQLAKAFGAQVTGVASTTQLELVRSIGADEVDRLHPRATSPTGPGGGTSSSIPGAAGPCPGSGGPSPPRGRWSSSAVRGADAGWAASLRNLRAPLLSRFVGQRLRMLASKQHQDDLQTLRELLEAGKLSAARRPGLPAARGPRGHAPMVEGHGGGKIVITV